ncbi:MAG TPA: hypothetical protein VHA14_09105 [Bryobacteraceae bacterium]|nr:hypothetical protein [Bryobacteraceae bacterium]
MSTTATTPIPSDSKNRQASQVKAAAHQQAFATGRGSRGMSPERDRPQRKVTPMERAQQEAAEARKKLQQSELESGRVRAEMKKLQEQMEAVKAAQAQEAQRAADREAGLWSDLNAVREQASQSARRASRYKTIALVMTAALPLMVWAAWRYGHPAVAQAASPGVARTAAAPSSAPIEPFATQEEQASDDTPSEFTKGAGRLNRALERFGNESAENVLRRVHDENAAHGVSVCAFEWHKGQVSLIFGNQPGMEIGVTMTRCAEAVERAVK